MSAPTSLRERREVLATARSAQRAADQQRLARQHHDHAELMQLARELRFPDEDPIGNLAVLAKIDTFAKIHGSAATGWYLQDLAEFIRHELTAEAA